MNTTVTFTLERQITEELILSYIAENDLADTLSNRRAVAEIISKQVLKEELKNNSFLVRDFAFNIPIEGHSRSLDEYLKEHK